MTIQYTRSAMIGIVFAVTTVLNAQSARAVTPESFRTTIQVINNSGRSQTLISSNVSGMITPAPANLNTGQTVTFSHTVASSTALAGIITYSSCRINWSTIKISDVFPKYTFSAAVDNTTKCSIISTPNVTTGVLSVKITNNS